MQAKLTWSRVGILSTILFLCVNQIHAADKPDQSAPTTQAAPTTQSAPASQPHPALYKYLAYMPKDYDQDQSRRWPMILFLHGAGECGDDLNKLKTWGIPLLCEQGKDDSYVAICPLCPAHQRWNATELNDLLDAVSAKYRVDPDRFYATGASMGGVGTWAIAQKYPDRFAAIVPVCGHGDPADVEHIKNLPVWIFHGEKDPTVPFAKAQAMYDALSKVGGRVKMTVYPNLGHSCWNQAYGTADLIPWLLQQTRGTSR